MHYTDDSEYEGQWKMGKKHGKGSLLYKSGLRLEGTWKDDVQTGQGRLIFSGNELDDVYAGDIANAMANGHGVRRTGKNVYVGSWVYSHFWR